MEYKFSDILGLISYSVANYKNALISRLNALGYPTSFNISNEALRDKLVGIVRTSGLDRLRDVLSIKIDKSITTTSEQNKLSSIFKVDASSKSLLDELKDWIIPGSTTTGDVSTTTTTSVPVINKTILVVVVVIGVVAMFIAYKMK